MCIEKLTILNTNWKVVLKLQFLVLYHISFKQPISFYLRLTVLFVCWPVKDKHFIYL